MRDNDHLFSTHDAHAVQEHQRHALHTEIAEMDGNRLLNTQIDDLVNYFVEKYRIDAPELDELNMRADQREARRDVSGDPSRMAYVMRSGPAYVVGTEVEIEVPFAGDAAMFRVTPSTYNSMPPHGQVVGSTLVFRYWTDNPQPDQIRATFDGWISDVRRYLQWQRESFHAFNESLAGLARATIGQRREKLLANQNLVAGLGIPLKRRADSTKTYAAPEVKRKLAPKVPPATAGIFRPEPVLEESEYQHILTVIEGMVKVMERSPKAFHGSDEETLRTHFIVQLNGHYEGQATGETFNYEGKTDILIRSGDRNVFVAECKFWGGPAMLIATIDQVLRYLSWRDSKAAILIFNRNKDFSKVLSAIPETVRGHPNFQRDDGTRGETGFRFAFRHKDDPAKSIHITVMAFDIPAPGPKDQ